MLDLSFGLPITIRDAALKMVAPGPRSEINREFFAQNNEREIEEGRGLEGYDKTDEKARELLRRLAENEPAYKRQRRLALEAEAEAEGGAGATTGQKLLGNGENNNQSGVGPVRTQTRKSQYGSAYGNTPYAREGSSGASRGGKGQQSSSRRAFPSAAALPIQPQDIQPPADRNITSLFVTGVEDDMKEDDIRAHFAQHGALRSLVCSHRSHCAFVNYMTRADAEKAAEACQGKALVKGVPLRVQWGKPKPLDSMDRDQRMKHARSARNLAGAGRPNGEGSQKALEGPSGGQMAAAEMPKPPGQDDDMEYAAMAGE
jgi:pre-mRNA-splicing factor RBM22/SLT11